MSATLLTWLPRRTYGIVASYRDGEIASAVAGVTIGDDNSLRLEFPKANPFRTGDLLVVHLDNRTGVEHFDIGLKVYRCSWKGRVTEILGEVLRAAPEEFVLMYSNHPVLAYKAPGWDYAPDPRPFVDLPVDGAASTPLPDPGEDDNKLGVWITRGIDRPHTTVMAFLSSPEDDIYLISPRAMHKSDLVHRDPRCVFAIDHRASWHFERRYEWNYTLVRARASLVRKGSPAFERIQALFVEKNPWELPFFSEPSIELFHLEPLGIECPDGAGRR